MNLKIDLSATDVGKEIQRSILELVRDAVKNEVRDQFNDIIKMTVKEVVDRKLGAVAGYTWANLYQNVAREQIKHSLWRTDLKDMLVAKVQDEINSSSDMVKKEYKDIAKRLLSQIDLDKLIALTKVNS